jgi:hypothetical protein
MQWEEHLSVSADGRFIAYMAITPPDEPDEPEETEEVTESAEVEDVEDEDKNTHKYPSYAEGPIAEEEFEDIDVEDLEDGEAAEEEDIEFEGNSDIWVMDTVTGERTRLTTDEAWDGNPSISADGTRIVFTSDRDGNFEIYIINRDGTGLTRVTNDEAIDDFATIT